MRQASHVALAHRCANSFLNEDAGAHHRSRQQIDTLITYKHSGHLSQMSQTVCIRSAAPTRQRSYCIDAPREREREANTASVMQRYRAGTKKERQQQGVIANGKEIVLIKSPILAFKRQRIPYSGLPTMQ